MSQQMDDVSAKRVSFPGLFLAFSQVALSSFGGGVPAFMHRTFVAGRPLLSDKEFAAAVALARIMPGANAVNLALLIGYRARGALGAITAALGLLVGPTVLSIGLVVLYERFVGFSAVAGALNGAAAGAAGLLIAMALQSITRLCKRSQRHERRAAIPLGLLSAMAVFALVGLLEVRTVWAVLCFMPISVAFAYSAARASPEKGPNEHG
jgi:chromate transporter